MIMTDTEDTITDADVITLLAPLPERCVIEVRAVGHTIDELEANALAEAVAFAGPGRLIDPEIVRTYQIKPLSPLFIAGGGYYAYLKISFTAIPPASEIVVSPRHGVAGDPDDETGESRSVGRRRRVQSGQTVGGEVADD